MYKSLSVCFGDEYKGRNYMDFDPVKTQFCKALIKELMLNDVNMDIEDIDVDVIGVISIFCDNLICEELLDLVYKDGVEFIRQKFLEMKLDIMMYELCAIYPEQVKNLLDDIQSKLLQTIL